MTFEDERRQGATVLGEADSSDVEVNFGSCRCMHEKPYSAYFQL